MKKRIMAVLFFAISLVLIMSAQVKATCGATTWDLTAAQTIKVGTVTVTNDAANVFVTYTLTYPGATFGTLQMWAGNDITLVPANDRGTPAPGQFPWQVNATGLTTSTLAIPISALGIADETQVCGASLSVVTHAEVTMDSNNDGEMQSETAFGGDTSGPGPRWWFFGNQTICCEQYAVITLKSFTAARFSGRKVALRWATASESENAGFNIMRRDGETGEYIQINSRIIPSRGTVVKGAAYTYIDKDVQRGKTYSYKLEDVDNDGTHTYHGPKKVTTK